MVAAISAKLIKSPRLAASVLMSAVIMIAIMLSLGLKQSDGSDKPPLTAGDTYKQQLRGQVDTPTGSPQTGRDPASQKQISLNSAASSPNSQSMANSNESGLSKDEAKAQGIGTNGCYIDYGIQGQECLAAHAATNGVLTCDGVRGHGGFPNGIKVTGTDDRYHLDTNHNGIACDASE